MSRSFSDIGGHAPETITVPLDRSEQVCQDFSHIQLKPDHEKRPIWVGQDKTIFLEAFSPLYKRATEFLVAIGEPISRPQYIHEYQLTKYSLYAAASMELTDVDIERVLLNLCKN